MGRPARRPLLILAIVAAMTVTGVAGSADHGTGSLPRPPDAPVEAANLPDLSAPAVAVDQSRFVAITSGARHACGLRADGTVACWGHNGSGRAEAPAGRFSSVQAGEWFTCGLRVEGRIECWGYLGVNGTGPPDGRFAALAVGRYHACGLRAEGTVACWGDRGGAQPEPSDGPFAAVEVGLSGGGSCGVRLDGTVSCWDDELSWGDQELEPPPGRFESVSLGDDYACGLREDRTVTCWSRDSRGVRYVDPPGGRFLEVVSGPDKSCGIRAERSLWMRTNRSAVCWEKRLLPRLRPLGGPRAVRFAGRG